MPRGRWYLKLRPSVISPAAASAEVIVSPANPVKRPAFEREIERSRAVDPLAGHGRQAIHHARGRFAGSSASDVGPTTSSRAVSRSAMNQ